MYYLSGNKHFIDDKDLVPIEKRVKELNIPVVNIPVYRSDKRISENTQNCSSW